MKKGHSKNLFRTPASLFGILFLLLAFLLPLQAQAEECTVSVLNRTATVQPDGSWLLPNVPSNMGLVRARMTCVVNGKTISGQSDYFNVATNTTLDIGDIYFDDYDEVPNAVSITTPTTSLTDIGMSTQLTVTATYPSGANSDVSAAIAGTSYTSSNPAIASVSADGVVTAGIETGRVIITASNEMVLRSLFFTVTQGSDPDSDGDGLPDDWEIANGLNPNDPIDALVGRNKTNYING